MPRPRLRARDVSCFILGAMLSLGCLIPASIFIGHRGSLRAGEQGRDAPLPPQAIASSLVRPPPATDAPSATAECRAVLRDCARRGARRTRQIPAQNTTSENEWSENEWTEIPPDGAIAYRQKKAGKSNSFVGSIVGIRKRPLRRKDEEVNSEQEAGPFSTMMPRYANSALEAEMHKHDRWVVDSISYLQSFDGGEDEAYHPPPRGRGPSDVPRPITLVVLTVNRVVPYLSVLVASLLRGHVPSVLGENVDMHIVNIERRPCRCSYPLLSDLEEKLPFVTFHDWTGRHSNIADDNSHKKYMADQRLDYIRTLELCLEKQSNWCIVMEDDAIASANMVPKFLKLIADVNVTDLGVLALYVPYTANGDEEAHRRLDLETVDGPSPRIRYQIEKLSKNDRVVANAYPSSVLGRMVEYLREAQELDAADLLLMRDFFPQLGLKKAGVKSSLCNHIGHYSEHRAESEMFRHVLTDVMFQLDLHDSKEVENNPMKG